ncbi:MAG: Fic family protein [Spirochaetia bacterium]|jgi:ATP-dependent DNA helicase RecG
MTEARLRSLLSERESIRLELKEAHAQVPQSLYETICAFLNREGGDIVLGINADGGLVGVDPDAVEGMCANIASATNDSALLDPPFLLYPQPVAFEGLRLIIVQVPESSRVHRLKGVVYDRGADGDFKVTAPEQIARLAIHKQNYYSESKVYPHLRIADLDEGTIVKARNLISARRPAHPWLALGTEALLRKAGLFSRDFSTGQEGLSLAAALVFGKEETITSLVPHYKTDALLRRQDTDRYDDRVDVRVNLVEAYTVLLGFIEKHMPDPFYMERDARISLRDKIFRELVANCLIHREYTHAGPSRIIIYRDRVEIENPCVPHHRGPLLPALSVPFQKNPLISRVFLQLGWVEEIGSGLLNVEKYLPLYAAGASAEFVEGDRFLTVIRLGQAPQDIPQDTQHVTPQAEDERTARILKFCQVPRRREEIQEMLGMRDREHFRKDVLGPLIDSGLIEPTIPDKPQSPKQRYRTRRAQA